MAVETEPTAPPRRSIGQEILPFVVVGALVVAVCALIVKVSGIDLKYWGDVHGDSIKAYEPQGVYGDNWDTAVFEPFSGGRIGPRVLLLALISYGGTFVIGERILRVLAARLQWPGALRWGGGFLIGYVPVFAMVRLVTLRFDQDSAPWICLTLTAAAAIWSVVVDFRTGHFQFRRDRFRWNWVVASVVALFLVIVVWTVQSGRNYLVSDSVLLFLGVARGDYGPMHWLPPFGRQMDEYAYNYPMIYAFQGSTTFALWFWMTNALAKASMTCLIAGTAWTLTKGRWIVACLSSALVLVASPIADPRVYVSLWGGQNPSIYLGHAGRFLGIILPVLTVLLFSEGSTRSGRIMAAGFGLALMATTAHSILFTPVVLGIGVLIVLARKMVKSPSARAVVRQRRVADIGVVVAVTAPLLAYGTLTWEGNVGLHGIPILVGAAGALVAIVWTAIGGDLSESDGGFGDALANAKLARLIPLAVGAVLGILLMGNIFYEPLMEKSVYRDTMESIFPAYEEPPLFVATFDTAPFRHADCFSVPTPSCSSFGGFVGYFGLTLAMALAAFVVVRFSKAAAATKRRDLILLMTQVALLDLGFFLTDFMGTSQLGGVYWIQTRFQEVGYYGILILLPVIMWNHLAGRARTAALLAVSAWVAVPLVTHPFAEQWWLNARYLRNVLT